MQQYLRDIQRGLDTMPDLLIVAIDGNCKGYLERKQEIEKMVPNNLKGIVIYAIPDPHLERWLLLDSSAFKAVLGRGCVAPDYKCERDRYKLLLLEAIRATGILPLVGGIEYARDLVNNMNLQRMSKADDSLGRLLNDLQSRFKQWSSS